MATIKAVSIPPKYDPIAQIEALRVESVEMISESCGSMVRLRRSDSSDYYKRRLNRVWKQLRRVAKMNGQILGQGEH